MKKRVKIILAAYAAFNVLLVAVAGVLFAEASEKAKWGPPLRLEVPQHINVGYLRMDPKFSDDEYWLPKDYVEYEFLEHVPDGRPEQKKDVIRVKRTVYETAPVYRLSDPPEGVYEALYWFCEEDGYWYLVCYPDFVVPASASPLTPGERIIEYGVPSAIVSRPGLYKLVMLNELGSFDFDVK